MRGAGALSGFFLCVVEGNQNPERDAEREEENAGDLARLALQPRTMPSSLSISKGLMKYHSG